ncbi:hypothetical protein R3P38DRAFT_3371638 [Favolaschia claudopus]|uniref:Uncharacterized protein n=1 Tax=Favolaschia claudopus TaxID=2862362 RepID=A0AAV9YYS8_9AGAR
MPLSLSSPDLPLPATRNSAIQTPTRCFPPPPPSARADPVASLRHIHNLAHSASPPHSPSTNASEATWSTSSLPPSTRFSSHTRVPICVALRQLDNQVVAPPPPPFAKTYVPLLPAVWGLHSPSPLTAAPPDPILALHANTPLPPPRFNVLPSESTTSRTLASNSQPPPPPPICAPTFRRSELASRTFSSTTSCTFCSTPQPQPATHRRPTALTAAIHTIDGLF